MFEYNKNNSKLEINDFVMPVSFTYNDILPIFLIFIYYATSKPFFSNYNLIQDYKKEKPFISFSPVIKRKYNNINNIQTIDSYLRPLVVEFIETIQENVPGNNLTLFFNNFNDLNFNFKNFKISNWFFNTHTAGSYKPISNSIELSKENFTLTIDHELLHASSTVYKKNEKRIYSGFCQITPNDNHIGVGFNEGYTQYLTEKYFCNKKEVLNSYIYEKRIAKIIEQIIGENTMQTLYFNADLWSLINYLKQYEQYENIYKFLTTLDFLRIHLRDKYLINNSNKIIYESLNYINSFLINMYVKKTLSDNYKNIDKNELFEKLNLLFKPITLDIKSINKRFDISNDFSNMITSLSSKFDLYNNKKIIRSKHL